MSIGNQFLVLLVFAIGGAAALPAAVVSPSNPPTHIPPVSWGVGAGFLYGWLGANTELHTSPDVGLTGGIGAGGFFAGGHLYLSAPVRRIRYRVTAGLAGVEHKRTDGTIASRVTPTIGIGLTFANTRNGYRGLDADISTAGVSVGFHF